MADDLAERNVESWKRAVVFFEECTSMEEWVGLIPVFELVRQISATERAKFFRAGHSMFELIISTEAQRGLVPRDHFIKIPPDFKGLQFVLEYWGNGEIIEQQTCPSNDLFSVLQPIMDHLWNNTRGPSKIENDI